MRNEFSARDTEKSETIAQLRNELRSTQAQLAQRDCDLDAEKREVATLRDEFDARHAEKSGIIADLRVQLSVAENRKQQLTTKNKALATTRKDLQSEIESSCDSLAEHVAENEKMGKICSGCGEGDRMAQGVARVLLSGKVVDASFLFLSSFFPFLCPLSL